MVGSMISEAMCFNINFGRLLSVLRILLYEPMMSFFIQSWTYLKKDIGELRLLGLGMDILPRIGLTPLRFKGGKRRPMA